MKINLLTCRSHTKWNFCILNRTILSAIHFNYNLRRETKIDDQGNKRVKVVYPKFKEGEVTVRELEVEQNYGTVKTQYGMYFLLWQITCYIKGRSTAGNSTLNRHMLVLTVMQLPCIS